MRSGLGVAVDLASSYASGKVEDDPELENVIFEGATSEFDVGARFVADLNRGVVPVTASVGAGLLDDGPRSWERRTGWQSRVRPFPHNGPMKIDGCCSHVRRLAAARFPHWCVVAQRFLDVCTPVGRRREDAIGAQQRLRLGPVVLRRHVSGYREIRVADLWDEPFRRRLCSLVTGYPPANPHVLARFIAVAEAWETLHGVSGFAANRSERKKARVRLWARPRE